MTAPQFPQLMTSAEVAGKFRVTVSAVDRWTRAGKLHPVRTPGGHRRYFDAEVRALLAGEALTPEQVEALKAQLGRTQ